MSLQGGQGVGISFPTLTTGTTVNSRISRNDAKANYGQPSQQEGTENTKSPQFKHVESDHWAGSRKSTLAPFRLIREFTVGWGKIRLNIRWGAFPG